MILRQNQVPQPNIPSVPQRNINSSSQYQFEQRSASTCSQQKFWKETKFNSYSKMYRVDCNHVYFSLILKYCPYVQCMLLRHSKITTDFQSVKPLMSFLFLLFDVLSFQVISGTYKQFQQCSSFKGYFQKQLTGVCCSHFSTEKKTLVLRSH